MSRWIHWYMRPFMAHLNQHVSHPVEAHLDQLHVMGQVVVHQAGEQCHLWQQEDVSELLDGGTFALEATDLLQWSMLGAPI